MGGILQTINMLNVCQSFFWRKCGGSVFVSSCRLLFVCRSGWETAGTFFLTDTSWLAPGKAPHIYASGFLACEPSFHTWNELGCDVYWSVTRIMIPVSIYRSPYPKFFSCCIKCACVCVRVCFLEGWSFKSGSLSTFRTNNWGHKLFSDISLITSPESKMLWKVSFYFVVCFFFHSSFGGRSWPDCTWLDLEAKLRDIVGSVPVHLNKANIAIKQVTLTFWFLVHIKVMFTLYHSLLSMNNMLKKWHIFFH